MYETLTFLSDERTVEYHFGVDIARYAARDMHAAGVRRVFLVSDADVYQRHGPGQVEQLQARGLHVVVYIVPPGERSKSMQLVTEGLEKLFAGRICRSDAVIAFGGGVVGNLAGTIAGLAFRGIRLYHFPTTYMAAMDSVLSFKQAVNGATGKNQIGLYLEPTAIYCDLDWLTTQRKRDIDSGLLEMAKNCLAIEPEFISELEARFSERNMSPVTHSASAWLLKASLECKSRVMINDPHEKRGALVLEYGHTAGHAIEFNELMHNEDLALAHGQCVGLGMLIEGRISYERGWLTNEELSIHARVICGLAPDLTIPPTFDSASYAEAVAADNKQGYFLTSAGQVPAVLLKGLGSPAETGGVPLTATSVDEFVTAAEWLRLKEQLKSSNSEMEPVE